MFNAMLRSPNVFLPVAAALLAGVSFALGWYLSPDETAKGYRLGNEDGYSIGYVDGMNGNRPDPNRFMWHEDYAFRREILGGREIGE